LWNKPWRVEALEFGRRLHAILTSDGTVRTFKPGSPPAIDVVNKASSHTQSTSASLQGLSVAVECPVQEYVIPRCVTTTASVSVADVRANPKRFVGKHVAVRGKVIAGPCLTSLARDSNRPDPLCPQSLVPTKGSPADQGITLRWGEPDAGPFCQRAGCCELPPGKELVARGILRTIGGASAGYYTLERIKVCEVVVR
jgi:hypothetical protein